MAQNIRNVAIIAHVDHGKTTLVDGLLRQTGTFRDNEAVSECVMDSNELERERGITILAKNTVVSYEGTRVNIIDTPGHADFGGEVERVLSMADGVLLLVDAAEGPMPQTRFVLQKAFSHHLKPIVVVNKIDKPDARAQEVVNEVFDLFIDLDADEDALEFPVFYGSGREGWMTKDLAAAEADAEGKNLEPLFKEIVGHIPAPEDDPEQGLQFRVTTLDWSDYVGRIAIGRVHRGKMQKGQRFVHIKRNGDQREVTARGVYQFRGLSREETDCVEAGDLCGVYGVDEIEIGDTIARAYAQNVLVNPMVEVRRAGLGPQNIIVGGEVNAPGLVEMTGPIGALEAVMLAGGFQNTAARGDVVVLRRAPGGDMMMRTVNLHDALRARQGADNIQIRRHDIIFVPRSTVAEVNLFVEQYVMGIVPLDQAMSFAIADAITNN